VNYRVAAPTDTGRGAMQYDMIIDIDAKLLTYYSYSTVTIVAACVQPGLAKPRTQFVW
jgi:hypothetical protein